MVTVGAEMTLIWELPVAVDAVGVRGDGEAGGTPAVFTSRGTGDHAGVGIDAETGRQIPPRSRCTAEGHRQP